jgi:hypothetical protein
MSSRHMRMLLPALIALLLFAPAARSQDITAFAGGLLPGTIKIDEIPSSLGNSPVFGVRFDTGFAAVLRLEHTIAFSNDLLFPYGQPGVTNARGFLLNSNLLVHIPVGRIVPYVTAGLGLISQFGSDNLPVRTKFAINYGGGVKLRKLAGPLGFRIDARGYTAVKVFSHAFNMFEISGGILLSF